MDNLQQATAGVLCDMVEKLAFMFGDIVDARTAQAPPTACRLAAIAYTGPFSGQLIVAAPVQFTLDLAANSLGLDADDAPTDANGDDAFKELLNVVCGNLLTTLAGLESAFNLRVPTVAGMDAAAWASLAADPAVVAIDIDGHTVLAKLTRQIGP